jgi:hypothetical protein
MTSRRQGERVWQQYHRPREIGRTWLWARNSSLKFQNDLSFLGRFVKPSLSEFLEIYNSTTPIAMNDGGVKMFPNWPIKLLPHHFWNRTNIITDTLQPRELNEFFSYLFSVSIQNFRPICKYLNHLTINSDWFSSLQFLPSEFRPELYECPRLLLFSFVH